MINSQALSDKTAIGLSLLCAIHCIAIPVALMIAPTLSLSFFGEEAFHIMLLAFVIPVSLFALTLGCRKHKNIPVMLIIIFGLALLLISGVFGHDLFGHEGEKIMTVISAAIIVYGHYRNHKLCQKKPQECDHC